MSATPLVWVWANNGRRWHLRASGADLALCGVGKGGWELVGDTFDRDEAYVFACISCISCLRARRTAAPSHATTEAGAGGGAS